MRSAPRACLWRMARRIVRWFGDLRSRQRAYRALGPRSPLVARVAPLACKPFGLSWHTVAAYGQSRSRTGPAHEVAGAGRRVLSAGHVPRSDPLGRESVAGIARLRRMSIRVQLARIHLLYGEWLRRERRRLDARERLHTAFEMFNAMGLEAFTGLAECLTAQEAQVARLARDGLSNTEIGERGVHQPAHVAYHLRRCSRSSASPRATNSRGCCPTALRLCGWRNRARGATGTARREGWRAAQLIRGDSDRQPSVPPARPRRPRQAS